MPNSWLALSALTGTISWRNVESMSSFSSTHIRERLERGISLNHFLLNRQKIVKYAGLGGDQEN